MFTTIFYCNFNQKILTKKSKILDKLFFDSPFLKFYIIEFTNNRIPPVFCIKNFKDFKEGKVTSKK